MTDARQWSTPKTFAANGVGNWSEWFSGHAIVSIGNGVDATTGAENTAGGGTFTVQYTVDDGVTAQNLSKDVDGNLAQYVISSSLKNVSVNLNFGDTPVKARLLCENYSASTKTDIFK